MAQGDASENQIRAWLYYGFRAAQNARRDKRQIQPVGEVRYVVGWAAEQMSRMRWLISVNDDTNWTIELPDGTTVTPDSTEVDSEQDDSLASASAEVLEKTIGWDARKTREVTTNLYVAGELDYVAIPKKVEEGEPEQFHWCVVSVVMDKRAETLKEAAHKVKGLWSHPADPKQPDAPLFGVLAILDEMDWLSKVSQSQSSNRVSMYGIMGVSDGLSVANGGDFWQEFNKMTKAKIADPTDSSMVILRGAKELIAPDGSGMAGLSWVIPTFPYNDRIDHQMDRLIQRLAYGLPIPPEILLGLQAQSRATAFQVEENSYRAHIEPPALIVASIMEEALQVMMPAGKTVTITPDPTVLLARRNSVTDAKEALKMGAISYAYYREVLNIPENAAARAEDLALLKQVAGHEAATTPDPANVAAQEQSLHPVLASVGGPDSPPLSDEVLATLSEFLSDLDHGLMAELAGATVQAVDRAREKVGANARSRDSLRASLPRSVPNNAVAVHLGVQKLSDAGVPYSEVIRESLSGLGDWWRTRVTEAQKAIVFVVGEAAAPKFTPDMVERSVELLVESVWDHTIRTLDSETVQPLGSDESMRVLSVAGGGN